jgi:energy-coupling factor transporter ATP-binding protein EcfA2
MRIIEFQAENVKKLKVVVIKPKADQAMVQLTGPNGSGKSSVLDSILYTLAGTEDLPSHPIRRGAEKGGSYVDLGDLRVMRKFTASGNVLIVEGKKGERYQRPQELLDKLFGNLSFDPLAFTRMKPKEQSEELRRLVKMDIDPDVIDQMNKRDYEARREANRRVKALEAQVNAINVVAELPAEPLDITALIDELQNAGTLNAEAIRNEDDLNRRKMQTRNDSRAIEAKLSEADSLKQRARALREEAKEDRTKLNQELAAIDAVVLPVPINTAELRDQIENARATNAQIQRRTEREARQKELDEETAKADALTRTMELRTKTKTDAIAAAEMPIAGLGFADGEVVYNELPFNQASSAEQLRVSCAIAMASNPEVRIILIKDGSLLDQKSLDIIEEMAQAKDYQIWIERVDTSGKIGIVMEDGEVKTVNEDEQPDAAQAAAEQPRPSEKAMEKASKMRKAAPAK